MPVMVLVMVVCAWSCGSRQIVLTRFVGQSIAMHVLEDIVHFASIASGAEAIHGRAVDDGLTSQHQIVMAIQQQLDAIVGGMQCAVHVT